MVTRLLASGAVGKTKRTVCAAALATVLITSMLHGVTVARNEQDGSLFSPRPPIGVVLAATLCREGNWHAMGTEEIDSLTSVIAREPFTAPPGVRISPPRLPHRIILWTVGDDGLIPGDVVECNDDMRMVYSTKRGRYFTLAGSKEREILLKQMERIKDGSEKPISVVDVAKRRPVAQGLSDHCAQASRRTRIRGR